MLINRFHNCQGQPVPICSTPSHKLAGKKSNLRRSFAHVRRNSRLKQRTVALRADDGAVVTDLPNMARILANYYPYVHRTDEGRDHPSPPEPSTIMKAPHFAQAAVHKELSTLDAAKGSGPENLHPLMAQVLADSLAEPITAQFNKSL